jgi:hypothetical protein
MVGLVVAAWLAMQVQGLGTCPSPGEVEEKLAPLLPVDFAASSTDRAAIMEEADGSVSVLLARPDGKTIARRRLPRAATCGEEAQTVAVSLAVWEAQIHPEIALRLDRLAAPPPPPRAAPPPVAQGEIVIARAAEPPPGRFQLGLGVAGIAGWQPGSFAPGARVDVLDGPRTGRWRARLSAVALGTHSESLPPGEAHWWRLYFALGGDYAFFLGRRWDLALGAAGVFGIATVEGTGYTSDRTTRTTDLGLETMLRAHLRLGQVRPWLGLTLVTWLRRQTLDVTGTGASLALPLAEPMLALGVDLSVWP